MIDLAQIINLLDLTVLTEPTDFSELIPVGGYSADLLSCVMIGAPHGGIWITLQAHNNIVAIAALLELSAVIITEGAIPDEATIQKANEEKVNLFSTKESSYTISGRLWEAGIH